MMSTQTIQFGRSTAIQSADYDTESGTLTVRFQKGGTTTVPNVGIQEFRAFSEAPSAGQFFNDSFKNRK